MVRGRTRIPSRARAEQEAARPWRRVPRVLPPVGGAISQQCTLRGRSGRGAPRLPAGRGSPRNGHGIRRRRYGAGGGQARYSQHAARVWSSWSTFPRKTSLWVAAGISMSASTAFLTSRIVDSRLSTETDPVRPLTIRMLTVTIVPEFAGGDGRPPLRVSRYHGIPPSTCLAVALTRGSAGRAGSRSHGLRVARHRDAPLHVHELAHGVFLLPWTALASYG